MPPAGSVTFGAWTPGVEQAQAIYETYHAQGVLSSSAQARVRALLDQED